MVTNLYYYIKYCFNSAASQMWPLGHILAILVDEYMGDDDECCLKLMNIVDILFSPCVSDDYVAYVATLIHDHHHEFHRIYPTCSVIPKMHFMVHMG